MPVKIAANERASLFVLTRTIPYHTSSRQNYASFSVSGPLSGLIPAALFTKKQRRARMKAGGEYVGRTFPAAGRRLVFR
jgi:hypothetical protein